MIQGVHVYSDNGETAWLSLLDPYGMGLAVLNITGLGPVKTDLRITNYGAQSGGYYNGSRVGTRNIVFTLKPLGPDIEYVRRWAYKLMDVEEHISMVFVTDYGDRRIDGYVESFEADIFSKNELFTVSVICPRPEFTDGDGVVLTSSSADTMNATFEFPFESRWLMDDIEFGTPQLRGEHRALLRRRSGRVRDPRRYSVGAGQDRNDLRTARHAGHCRERQQHHQEGRAPGPQHRHRQARGVFRQGRQESRPGLDAVEPEQLARSVPGVQHVRSADRGDARGAAHLLTTRTCIGGSDLFTIEYPTRGAYGAVTREAPSVIIDDFYSASWTERFWDIGEAQLELPMK